MKSSFEQEETAMIKARRKYLKYVPIEKLQKKLFFEMKTPVSFLFRRNSRVKRNIEPAKLIKINVSVVQSSLYREKSTLRS